jgi:DNA polymerase III delta prime subunit
MAKLAVQFLKRVESILVKENVEYEKAVIVSVIESFFPDWRRVLNELQRYSALGKIDSGILSSFQNASLQELFEACKSKKFDDMRKWVHENSDQDQNTIFRNIFDSAETYVVKKTIPLLVLKIADYQYKSAFVVDQEINLLAFLIELSMELEWL